MTKHNQENIFRSLLSIDQCRGGSGSCVTGFGPRSMLSPRHAASRVFHPSEFPCDSRDERRLFVGDKNFSLGQISSEKSSLLVLIECDCIENLLFCFFHPSCLVFLLFGAVQAQKKRQRRMHSRYYLPFGKLLRKEARAVRREKS